MLLCSDKGGEKERTGRRIVCVVGGVALRCRGVRVTRMALACVLV